jgi:chorismate mutase
MRAIRGAITVSENTEEAIDEATQVLLRCLEDRNDLHTSEIVSVFFTLTPDLDAAFPARSARAMGWDVAMLDMQEVDVPGALQRCLRVLVHVQVDRPVSHAYLREARHLRPDLEPAE